MLTVACLSFVCHNSYNFNSHCFSFYNVLEARCTNSGMGGVWPARSNGGQSGWAGGGRGMGGWLAPPPIRVVGLIEALIGPVGCCSAHHSNPSFWLFWLFCHSGHSVFIFIDSTHNWMLCGKSMNFSIREAEVQSLSQSLPSLLAV